MASQTADPAHLLLTAIVASSDDAIIGLDLSAIVTSWNQGAERTFGYGKVEAIGQPIGLIIPAEELAAEEEVLRRIRAGESVGHYEAARRHKDGRRVEVSVAVSAVVTADGTIVGVSTIARDITERNRLQRDALRLAAIVESSDDAIISKDLNGIVTSWNRSAERVFGFSASEMIGRSIRRLIPQDQQQEEDEVLARIRRGDRVEHFETMRCRKDGARIAISLTVSPVRTPDGTVIGASKIARDITGQKDAEAERQRLLAAAQEAVRLKDEFLATLSHELRTPLNAMVGYLRMMQSGLLAGDKQRRALDTVGRNATSLSQIVEDVLDVSRIISGKVRLHVQTVDLALLVREAISTVRPAADAKGVRIETMLDPPASPVSGDPERLQQILWNLLSNAVKFTDAGGHVEVGLATVGSQVEVTVSDTGVGISRDFLPHVFERFRQADAGIGRARGGLGLGLAITRHLVELQGGRITAASGGLGQGSTFRIALPIRIAKTESVGEGRPALAPHAVERISVPNLQALRILAVDDDPDALALVREILELAGATIIAVGSAEGALAAIEQAVPDVLGPSDARSGADRLRAIGGSSQGAPQRVPGAPEQADRSRGPAGHRRQARAAPRGRRPAGIRG
jgi:PAS domain S-box-containing protein